MSEKIRLVVTHEGQTVAVVEDWEGPVPRVGEWLFHPPLKDDGSAESILADRGTAGCVKQVTWGIYGRFQGRVLAGQSRPGHFVRRAQPVVEVVI